MHPLRGILAKSSICDVMGVNGGSLIGKGIIDVIVIEGMYLGKFDVDPSSRPFSFIVSRINLIEIEKIHVNGNNFSIQHFMHVI